MLPSHVSRSEHKTAGAIDSAGESALVEVLEVEETSGVKSTSELGLGVVRSAASRSDAGQGERIGVTRVGKACIADEAERTRLIADLTRLLSEPCVPESTRVAGLTLIGWLARRRVEEMPHGLGIEQARKSVGRTKACRSRAR
ncbi:MAG TPA: hypothetical protein VEK07_20050 [Polyangiaceae bacterium]|nr:hypothetical protein [Polyangiaceae bacterium]